MVSQWFISKKTIIFQGFRGGQTCSRGVSNFFKDGGGGVQMLISKEIHCDFPVGGGPDPLSPPLDLRMFMHKDCAYPDLGKLIYHSHLKSLSVCPTRRM